MFLDSTRFGKLPVAFQAILGLVLFATGAYMILFASFWSQGSQQFFHLYAGLGVLYMVTGMPPLLEGMATMLYGKSKVDPHA